MLPMTKNTFNTEEKAKRLLERASSRWVEPDRKALEGSDTLQIMVASLAESVRQGAKGAAYDGMLIGQRTWGFTFRISMRQKYKCGMAHLIIKLKRRRCEN